MLKSEAAAYLAGVTQTEGAEASAPTNLHVITGEVGEASADGKTLVKIDGLMFSESDDQFIEVDALGGLEEGDIATIVLTGEQGPACFRLDWFGRPHYCSNRCNRGRLH